MDYFQRIYKRVLEGSAHKNDHYRALRHYLVGSRSLKYFKSEQELGYTECKEPSRHPWLENMRYLLRQLGYDQLIEFLNWCIQHHKAPWRGYLKRFKTEQAKSKNQTKTNASSLSFFAKKFKISRNRLLQLKRDKKLPYPLAFVPGSKTRRGYCIYDLWQLCIAADIDFLNHPLLKVT